MKIYELIPFRNYISNFPMSGAEIRKMIETYAGSLRSGRVSLNFSNVRCTWERNRKGVRVSDIFIGGDRLQDDRIYTVGTIDYVIDQAERYLGFVPEGVTTTDRFLFNIVIEKIERDRTIGGLHIPWFQER